MCNENRYKIRSNGHQDENMWSAEIVLGGIQIGSRDVGTNTKSRNAYGGDDGHGDYGGGGVEKVGKQERAESGGE